MASDEINRRDVMAGTLALAASALVPAIAAAEPGPDFIVRRKKLDEAMTLFRAATAAKIAARPRILADMRGSRRPLDVYFGAPEIKARAVLRMDARAAAEEIFFSPASNPAEIALQIEARSIFDNELGGENGMPRQWTPPGKRAT